MVTAKRYRAKEHLWEESYMVPASHTIKMGKLRRRSVTTDQDGYDRRYNGDGSLVYDTHYKDGKPDGNWMERLSGSVDFTRCSSYKDRLL